MPRKSANALLARVDGKPNRVKPPDYLGKAEQEIFLDIVSSCDSRHFVQSDLPLLVEYVSAILLGRKAAKELKAEPVQANGKVSPWITIQEKSVRAMTSLSLRLRLSPQSRQHPRTTQRRTPMTLRGVNSVQ